MPKLQLFPNPYHHLDHKGRLAGVAVELEPLRAGHVRPLSRKIGAKLQMTEGSYVPGSVERGEEGPGIGRQSRADLFHVFSDEPVTIECHESLVAPYQAMLKRGEVLDGIDVPLDDLAKARLDCIAQHVAAYGAPPDTSTWLAQFPIDDLVAKASEALVKANEEQAKKAAEKAAEDAKTAPAKQAATTLADRRKRLETRLSERGQAANEATPPVVVPPPPAVVSAPELTPTDKRHARKQET